MPDEFSRTRLLLGDEGLNKLQKSSVAVFGVGGVGSYIAEALARSGVGRITLIDNDVVSVTNINRQLVALQSTVGRKKVEVAKERILDINPEAEVVIHDCFYTGTEIDLSRFDYIADAIDSVTSKLNLIENASRLNIPIISSMGTGNKLDPTKIIVTDIYKTHTCPLAKILRYELKKRNVKKLKVVYSTEPPCPHKAESDEITEKRKTIGSVSFVPSVAGLVIAGEIIKNLTEL
ncbi:MAG: tRNA threonylcarbamoyladenosine dehydratase [Ruminococcus sp.]|nr:tRNA threonylcarbamoyladenosine dehydratase [Ruminococcus sp.]